MISKLQILILLYKNTSEISQEKIILFFSHIFWIFRILYKFPNILLLYDKYNKHVFDLINLLICSISIIPSLFGLIIDKVIKFFFNNWIQILYISLDSLIDMIILGFFLYIFLYSIIKLVYI